MHSQSSHPCTTPDVRDIGCVPNHLNHQQHGRSGNFPIRPIETRISVRDRQWSSSQGGSSVASTNRGQNSTLSSFLNNSHLPAINQHVTLTQSTRQGRRINTPTTKLGTRSHSTPAPGGTSKHRIVSSPKSGIVITPISLRGLENLHTPIHNPEARAIITNPL